MITHFFSSLFFFFKFLLYVYYSVLYHVHAVSAETTRGHKILGTGIVDHSEQSCGMLGTKLGSCARAAVLLTAEPAHITLFLRERTVSALCTRASAEVAKLSPLVISKQYLERLMV